MKKFTLIIAVIFLLALACSCRHENIFYPVECVISLDEGNTYRAGEAVTFNISDAADNIVFYSGEDNHQYQYRNRYEVAADEVRSMVLSLMIQHRFGNPDPVLEIYYTNDFDGLDGTDGQADRDLVEEMYDSGMPGWTRFPYNDPGVTQDVYHAFEADVSDCITNFCLAFFWNPGNPERVDTYWINGTLTVDIEGAAATTYTLSSLLGTVVMMNEINGTYYYYNNGNGSIRLNAAQDLILAGGTGIDHSCVGWVFSYPRAFNRIAADTGETVKNLQNYADSYSYVYEQPGTYTATFVSTNSNYIDSDTKVQEITFTILDDLTDYQNYED